MIPGKEQSKCTQAIKGGSMDISGVVMVVMVETYRKEGNGREGSLCHLDGVTLGQRESPWEGFSQASEEDLGMNV